MSQLRRLLLGIGFACAACRQGEPVPDGPASKPAAEVQALATLPAAQGAAEEAAPASAETPPGDAQVGQAAPAFSLPDLDGKPMSLADFTGKIVVLEWFNPECPFVRLAHTKGSLVGLAARYQQQGVVWLGVNSAAPGRQGHGGAVTGAGQRRYQMKHPILLDETGEVGKRYGAQRTPELYVIDAAGVLRYRGAIDNSPDGEGQDPADGKLVNYVDAVLSALIGAQPVPYAQTEAYGCTVKY